MRVRLPMALPAEQTSERRTVLLRRLSDARSILGCGDDPDRTPAIEEIERLERELQQLEDQHAVGPPLG